VDQKREFEELGRRLLRLHSVLLEREREAHERVHGPSTPRELLQLVLGDPQFEWLRALSRLVTRIDTALEGKGPVTETTAAAFPRDAERLLRSANGGAFGAKYREALQASPSAVMAHADVVKMFPRRPA
jgi:hypothetical protein